MKRMTVLAALATLTAGAVTALAAEPTDASVDELLRLSKASRLLEQATAQIDRSTAQTLQASRPPGELNAAQEQTLARMRQQIKDAQHELMDPQQFHAMILHVYKASFTQAELDGIIKFYKTPAGQAMTDKMPLVMQNMMQEMQGMLGPYVQKIQAIQREAARDLKAESGAAAANPETSKPP